MQSRVATTEAPCASAPGSPAIATTEPGSEIVRSANASSVGGGL